MELKINKITYTLRNFNTERRVFFIKNVLNLHDKIYSKETSKTEKNNLINKQAVSILDLVWMFIFPQEKKELRDKSLMKIEVEDYTLFLKFLNEKLKEYSDYIKTESPNEGGVKQDISQVYAFLSKEFGWTFEHIKEMDELELLKAIKQAIKIKKTNQINQINNNALVAAFGAGSKKAKKAIDDINNEAKQEQRIEHMKQTPAKRNTPLMTNEEMRRAVSGRRG